MITTIGTLKITVTQDPLFSCFYWEFIPEDPL